jgi:hypothetical protein
MLNLASLGSMGSPEPRIEVEQKSVLAGNTKEQVII